MEQNGTCDADRLRPVGLFNGLTRNELDDVAARCKLSRYAAGDSIIEHGADGDEVFLLIEGTVQIFVFSLVGKQIVFRDFGPGRVFGELAAIDGGPRSANVIARTDVWLAVLAADEFRDLMRRHPKISLAMMKRLATLVRLLSERVVEFTALSVRNRVHAELLRLARDTGVAGDEIAISPAPTHEDIANRVSTNREAVTRELNRLDRAGLIERPGRNLIIRDMAALAGMVEDVFGPHVVPVWKFSDAGETDSDEAPDGGP